METLNYDRSVFMTVIFVSYQIEAWSGGCNINFRAVVKSSYLQTLQIFCCIILMCPCPAPFGLVFNLKIETTLWNRFQSDISSNVLILSLWTSTTSQFLFNNIILCINLHLGYIFLRITKYFTTKISNINHTLWEYLNISKVIIF